MDAIAPDIGSLFDYNGRQYVVIGWARKFVRPPYTGEDLAERLIEELLIEEESLGLFRFATMQCCLREEATHVLGRGVCGCLAPISEIQVTGMAQWIPEHLEYQQNRAAERGAQHVMLT
jgi:hypothetical protein